MSLPNNIVIFQRIPSIINPVPLADAMWVQRSATSWSYTGTRIGEWDLQRLHTGWYRLICTRPGTNQNTRMCVGVIHNCPTIYYPHLCGIELETVSLGKRFPDAQWKYPGYCFAPVISAASNTNAISLQGIHGIHGIELWCDQEKLVIESSDETMLIMFKIIHGRVDNNDKENAVRKLLPICGISSLNLLSWADIIYDFQSQNYDDTIVAFYEFLNQHREVIDAALVWGQMSAKFDNTPATGCCLAEMELHERNTWMNNAEILYGMYSRPDKEDGSLMNLPMWLRFHREHGAKLSYIDHVLGSLNTFGELQGYTSRDCVIEWPQLLYPGMTLISGCVYQMPGKPKNIPWMARTIFPSAVYHKWLLGAENDDYRGCGPDAKYLTPRNAHLLGCAHTVREFWNDDVVLQSANSRLVSRFWSRRPVYKHTEGLILPSGVRATRWQGKNDEIIICWDAYDIVGGNTGIITIIVDNRVVGLRVGDERIGVSVIGKG